MDVTPPRGERTCRKTEKTRCGELDFHPSPMTRQYGLYLPSPEALTAPDMEAAIAKERSRFAELLTGNVPRARRALK